MHRPLPALAVLLGVLGLLPFLACGLAALQADPLRSLVATRALIAYAATVLGFLGGVHWGFALDDEQERSEARRLGFGVLPAIGGWVAVMLSFLLAPSIALVFTIGVLIAVTAGEARAAARGYVPTGYMRLRWGLSIAVLAILTAVTVLRLLGAAIAL